DRGLEDRLVRRDLVQDLLSKKSLVALTNALQVAEWSVETHPAMNHPGTALGERHQVDFVNPVAVALPGERPARRAGFVGCLAAAIKFSMLDVGELTEDQGIQS